MNAPPVVSPEQAELTNLRYALLWAVMHFARRASDHDDVALLAEMRDQLRRDPILHEAATIAVRAALVRVANVPPVVDDAALTDALMQMEFRWGTGF